MAQITAGLVKELRERTGCGMMECKKALVEADGDIDMAIEEMRKRGMAKNDKLASRVAAEGRIGTAISEDGKSCVLLEVNCETDFVSGGDQFAEFVNGVAQTILENRPADVDAIADLTMADGQTVKAVREELLLKLGENIQIRRFEIIENDGPIGQYLHGSRIGSVVAVEGGNAELAKDLAMHAAASNPQFLDADCVPGDVLEKEKEILTAQAQDSGKPAEIIEKMIEGRLRKHLAEITFVGQPFVKDPDQTVEKLLKAANAKIVRYVRMAVGEGIEKKEENFAEEVMAQVKSS